MVKSLTDSQIPPRNDREEAHRTVGFLFQVDEQNKQDQNDDYGTYDRANICKVHFFLSDSSIQPFSFSINLCDFFVFGARNCFKFLRKHVVNGDFRFFGYPMKAFYRCACAS